MSRTETTVCGGRRSERPPGPAPLVSILVTVFEAVSELQTLLDNLRSRDLSEAEVVVVDGGSRDGTRDLLARSNDVVHFWISQPDRGIYDAMNTGVQAARGAYLLHLNAGDALRRLPLDALRQCLADGIDVASFCVMVDGTQVFCPREGVRSRIENTWHHQGTFYRREAHLLYDATYRVYGDFEHNMRLRAAGCSVRLFPEIVADHATGGASSITNTTPAIRENWRVVRQYAGVLYVPLAFAKLHLYLLARRWRSYRKRTA